MFKRYIFVLFMPVLTQAQTTDPTKPLSGNAVEGVVKKAQTDFVLQSIIEDQQHRKVVINGQLLKKGDQINQYRLLEVTDSYVVLSSEEKDIKLSLFSSVVANSKSKDN